MREYVSPDVLANWVSMLRADIDGAICIADDDEEARFYERCAHEEARVVPAPNGAIRLLTLVEARGIEGVVATVRGPMTPECQRGNVFRPHLGDIASVLFASNSCNRAIADICGEPWMLACQKVVGPIRPRVAWVTRQFADLLAVCLDEGLTGPDSSRLPDLIRWDAFELDWGRVGSMLPRLSNALLQPIRDSPPVEDVHTAVQGCNGMDAVRVLAAATQLFRPRGIRAHREVSAKDLIGTLRVAFDLEEIESDDIFWHMKRWERRNIQYPLLRQWRDLDPLGVVWDQRYWERDLVGMLRFFGSSGGMAAFKMDLDNFKPVNEKLGHLAGDEAIRVYCSIVKRLVGKVGEVYRRGGDEVVVLAPELDPTRARALAESVRATIESEFTVWAGKRALMLPPTASVGVVISDRGQSPQQVMQLLDEAQSQAKEGKNRVVCLP